MRVEKIMRFCTVKRMKRVNHRLLVWNQTTGKALQPIDKQSLSLLQVLALSCHLCTTALSVLGKLAFLYHLEEYRLLS